MKNGGVKSSRNLIIFPVEKCSLFRSPEIPRDFREIRVVQIHRLALAGGMRSGGKKQGGVSWGEERQGGS